MNPIWRSDWPRPAMLALAMLLGMAAREAPAQFGPFISSNQFDLSDTVQLDRAESTVLAQLERVRAYLADRQWDEAVDTLQKVMETSEGKLLEVTPQRWVNLGDYCQLQLAKLPPEALKLYRGRDRPDGAEVVPGGRRPARPQAALQRRRAGICQPLGRQGAAGFGRNGPGGGRLCRGPMALGADHSRSTPGRPPPTPGPAIPTRTWTWRRCGRGWCWSRSWKGATARAREELAELVRLHPGRGAGWAAGRSTMPRPWPN